jgi:hypothetical protein
MADGIDFVDYDAAWAEMTKVRGDLAGGISRKMKQNSEWRMTFLHARYDYDLTERVAYWFRFSLRWPSLGVCKVGAD